MIGNYSGCADFACMSSFVTHYKKKFEKMSEKRYALEQ